MDELLDDFIAETRETLQAIEGELIAWERDPGDRAMLDGIFRFVHTVKGSCGFLDLPRLTRLSHAAEDALDAVRQGEIEPSSRFVSAVLAIVDRIAAITEALETDDAVFDDDAELIDMLEQLRGDDDVTESGEPQTAEPDRERRNDSRGGIIPQSFGASVAGFARSSDERRVRHGARPKRDGAKVARSGFRRGDRPALFPPVGQHRGDA